ncbi:MAG: hypothetical protein V4531_10370 [Actinomycetota bacterium]
MQFGFVIPTGDVDTVLEMSVELEQAGMSAPSMPASRKSVRSRLARSAQSPSPPIWAVAQVGSERSMARAPRCDGVLPFRRTSRDPFAALEPDDVRELRRLRPDAGWDIVLEGSSNPDDAVSMTRVAALRDAGASWWIESPWNLPGGIEAARARGREGPPPV